MNNYENVMINMMTIMHFSLPIILLMGGALKINLFKCTR